MFGYNRRDLVGLNIDVLVPQPLATVHQYFMLKYIESGREVPYSAFCNDVNRLPYPTDDGPVPLCVAVRRLS